MEPQGMTVAVRFTHGRYAAPPAPGARHARPAEPEWPPSPWRVAAAVLATWRGRHPDVPVEAVLRLMEQFATPPHYWLPPTHLMRGPHPTDPDAAAPPADGEGDPDQVSLRIDRTAEVLLHWRHTHLHAADRVAFDRLLRSTPHLGNPASTCVVRLLDGSETDAPRDERGWCRPTHHGGRVDVRVLAPAPGVDLNLLAHPDPPHASHTDGHAPVGARWVAYVGPHWGQTAATHAVQPTPQVTAIRWSLAGAAPIREENGVLAAERLRQTRLAALEGLQHPLRGLITGHVDAGPGGAHRAAHWLWLGSGGRVTDVALWLPAGVPDDVLGPLIGPPTQVLTPVPDGGPTGYGPAPTQVAAVGDAPQVLSELCAPDGARVWVSRTPYLMSTRRTATPGAWTAHLHADVAHQWRSRHPDAEPCALTVAEFWPHLHGARRLRPTHTYRRHRWAEPPEAARPGVALRLEFAEPQYGPLLLGELCHVGFGQFIPATE